MKRPSLGFVFGLMAGVALTFLVAAASQSSPDLGRYQVVGMGISTPLLLDTATGGTWELIGPPKAKYQSDAKKLRLPAWYPMKKHDKMPSK